MPLAKFHRAQGGREPGFDVRGISAQLPELAVEAERFPQELIAPYWEDFFAEIQGEALASFKNFASARVLGNILHLRLLFPERRTQIDALFEAGWNKYKDQFLTCPLIPNQFPAARDLSVSLKYLFLLDPKKYQDVCAAWGRDNIERIIPGQNIFQPRIFHDLLMQQEIKLEHLAEWLRKTFTRLNDDPDLIRDTDIYTLSILYPNFMTLLCAQNDRFFPYRDQVREELIESLEHFRAAGCGERHEAIYSAVKLKLFYAQGFRLTAKGLEFNFGQNDSAQLQSGVPLQPNIKDF